MGGPSYIVFSALLVISVLYGHEDRWPLGRRGFLAASSNGSKDESAYSRWPLGLTFLGLAPLPLRRRYLRRSRDDHLICG
jgi:hypothetical protein